MLIDLGKESLANLPLYILIFQKERDKLAYMHTIYLDETNPKPNKQK